MSPRLTAKKVQNAKPRERRYKLFDQGGLYLEVSPSGRKWWRYKFRLDGREHRVSLGVYPRVSLKEARERHAEAHDLVDEGINPRERQQAEEAAESPADSFEAVAREWYAKHSRGKGEKYIINLHRLEHHVFGEIGARPIAEVDAAELLGVLRKIEAKGVIVTAHKVLGIIRMVFGYAIATGRVRNNPALGLSVALERVEESHHAAIIDPPQVAHLLRLVWSYMGTGVIVANALKVLAYTFQRPGNVVHMEWGEVNFDEATWIIPKEKMKGERHRKKVGGDHLVPLPRQVIDILKDQYEITREYQWVFTGRNPTRPLSANTLNAALKTLGIDTQETHTSHGWRAMARTLIHERLEYRPEIIEHQLGHRVPDLLGQAYNRTRFIEQRRKMMQDYADYLDSLRQGATRAN